MPDHVVAVSKKNFQDLTSKAFRTKVKGKVFEGFVVRKLGKYYVYHNLCRHLPITLDLNDNNFFTHDKSHLQCHMHGATYEIESGVCIGGPCVGAKLESLRFTEEEARIIIQIPESVVR